ncbi:MAG: SUMF1/EgtB/PvdO family nonheme iron enzyme [Myxococcota bacterium]
MCHPLGIREVPPGSPSDPSTEDPSTSSTLDPSTDPSTQDPSTQDPSTQGPSSGDTGGPCPVGMAWIDPFCIDRWEAHLVGASPYEVPGLGAIAASDPGEVPQGYTSAVVAADACAGAGKRLCTHPEWLRACGGPTGTVYPYGDTYDPAACNDARAVHPVVELFGADATWGEAQLNDPRLNQLPDGLDPTGANPGCVSAEGVYDLHGNLHEWIDDPDGTFVGGFYVDAVLNGPGCSYTTTAHDVGWHDYSPML